MRYSEFDLGADVVDRSIIIRHLKLIAAEDKSEPVVAFIYMDHKTNPTLLEHLGSVVRQIVADMLYIPSYVKDEWKKQESCGSYGGKYTPLSMEILTTFMIELISDRPF